MTGPTAESASAAPSAGSSWREKHAAKYGDLRARQAERKAKSVPLASGDKVEVTSNGKTLKGTVSERYRPGVDRMVSVKLEGGSSVQSFGAASVSKVDDGVSPEIKSKYKLPDLKKASTSALMVEWEKRQKVHDFSGSSSYGAKRRLPNKADDDFIDEQMDEIDNELRKRWAAGEDLEFWFPYG